MPYFRHTKVKRRIYLIVNLCITKFASRNISKEKYYQSHIHMLHTGGGNNLYISDLHIKTQAMEKRCNL